MSNFVKERVESNSKAFWSPMKKLKLKSCHSAAKKVNVSLKGKVIEMKSNISLFSRLVIATRSRLDVDMKKCLSQYEFSTVPKPLFAQDGSMHHCLAKYKLTEILESLPKKMCTDINNTYSSETVQVGQTSASEKVAIVDGMAQLHCITKPTSVKTCHNFGLYFSNFMDEKYRTYTKVHLIFDSYKSGSLKIAIRDHWQRTTGRTQYKICQQQTSAIHH